MRKNIFSISILCALAVLALFSCQKKNELNLNLKPVTNLTSLADGFSVDLETTSTPDFKFSWQTTQAEDGGLVLYEVLFDKEGGDFSKPVFTQVSDGAGVKNMLTLTKVQLDAIAALNGAGPLTSTKLKWTVRASKGWNGLLAAESRTITLKRMLPLPQSLSVSGTGTEAGSNKMKMTKLSEGVFEVFVKVTAGDIKFVADDNSEYSLQQTGATRTIIGGGSSTGLTGTQEKVLWIKVDFGAKSGTVTEVKSMGLWYCVANQIIFTLPYVGNGVWKKTGFITTLQPAPWNASSIEQRYKYKMVINDGTNDKDKWVNSTFWDPSDQDGQYPSSLAYRTIDLSKNEGNQWDQGWKFDRNYLTAGSVVDYWVQLNASEAYNQNYKKQ